MFINVQHLIPPSHPGQGQTSKLSVYECDRVFVTEGDTLDDKTAIFEMESDKGAISLTVIKADVDVFLTNNRGETINSWRWASFGKNQSQAIAK